MGSLAVFMKPWNSLITAAVLSLYTTQDGAANTAFILFEIVNLAFGAGRVNDFAGWLLPASLPCAVSFPPNTARSVFLDLLVTFASTVSISLELFGNYVPKVRCFLTTSIKKAFL
jgi:hypothetical protein